MPNRKGIVMDESAMFQKHLKNLVFKCFWNIADIPQPLLSAISSLTFKKVGLQPEFEPYELAVTPPGVAT